MVLMMVDSHEWFFHPSKTAKVIIILVREVVFCNSL